MIDEADISFIMEVRGCNRLIDHAGSPAIVVVLIGFFTQTDDAGSSRAINSGCGLRYCR